MWCLMSSFVHVVSTWSLLFQLQGHLWAVTPWAMCTWEAFYCYSFHAVTNCKSVSDPPSQIHHKTIAFSSSIFPFCRTLLGKNGSCRGMSLIPSDLRVSRLFQGLSHLLPKAQTSPILNYLGFSSNSFPSFNQKNHLQSQEFRKLVLFPKFFQSQELFPNLHFAVLSFSWDDKRRNEINRKFGVGGRGSITYKYYPPIQRQCMTIVTSQESLGMSGVTLLVLL